MKPRSLAIGIPVCDRRHLVEFNAFSLSRIIVPPDFDLRIIVQDDCSTEFEAGLLGRIYPHGSTIIRREHASSGADFAAMDLLELLLAEGTDAIMILDSDLIARRDMLQAIVENLPLTDGFLSLFNTNSHPVLGESGMLLLKSSVGAAGTVWTRQIASDVLANVERGERWDWRFCDYLRQQNIGLFCLRNSAVQHLGFASGQNSNLKFGDFGNGFTDQVAEYLYFLTEEIVKAKKNGFNELDRRLSNIERIFSGFNR